MQLSVQQNYYSKSTLGEKHPKRYCITNNISPMKRNYINLISFKGGEDVFDYQTNLDKNFKAMRWFRRWFLRGKKKAEQITNLELIDFRKKQCEKHEKEIAQREEDLKQREKASDDKIKTSDERIRQREQASDARIKASDENIKKREKESSARIEASDLDIQSRKLTMDSKEKEFEARVMKTQQNIQNQVDAYNLQLQEATNKSNEEIKARTQAITTAEKEFQAIIEETEREFDAYKARKEQEIADAEKESEERIKRKESTVDKKLADAKKVRDDGFQMKEEALDIRAAATKIKNEVLKIREDSLQREESYIHWGYGSDERKQKEILEQKRKDLDERVASVDKLEEQLKKEIKETKVPLERLEEEAKALKSQNQSLTRLVETLNLKGFERIVGCQAIKDYLCQCFVNPIIWEKEGKATSMASKLLILAPDGCGKDTLVQAIADQAGCNLVKVKATFGLETNFQRLKNAAEEARASFTKDKKRTILQVHNLGFFIPKGKEATNQFNNFLKGLTAYDQPLMIVTTDNLVGVDDLILNQFPRATLGFGGKEDTKAILEYYAKVHASSAIDYAKLTEVLLARTDGQAFSNNRIREAVHNIVHSGGTVTQESLLESIKKLVPDISKEAIERFANDKVRMFKK